jgi:hypothetical protein
MELDSKKRKHTPLFIVKSSRNLKSSYLPQSRLNPVPSAQQYSEWPSDISRTLYFLMCYFESLFILYKTKHIPWSESASKLYRPSDRRLSAKLVPTFADKGCHVVSVTDPYGRILDFSRPEPLLFLSSSYSTVLTLQYLDLGFTSLKAIVCLPTSHTAIKYLSIYWTRLLARGNTVENTTLQARWWRGSISDEVTAFLSMYLILPTALWSYGWLCL